MPQGKKRAIENNKNEGQNKRLKVSHDSHGRAQGCVLTCGQNDVGQLGLGTEIMERTRMALVDVADPVIQIVAGGMHTVCLSSTGQVYTFGCNDEGALGRDTSEEGSDTRPGKVALPAPIVMVSAGDSHTSALTDDGRVYAWGTFRDANGSIGLTNRGIEKLPIELIQEEVVIKVVSGGDHLVCLTDRGELLSLGCAEQGQLGRIAECFATRGGRKGLDMLLSPGRVKVKKYHSRKLAKFSDVWAAAYVTFAKENSFEDMVNRFLPERVRSFSESGQWSTICGGLHHTVALDSNGKVFTLGREDYGRLGLGKNCGEKQLPTLVPALKDMTCTAIGAGGCCSFAVMSDGSLYSWGMGSNNQLGLGEEDDQDVPTKVAGKQLETR
ncbi:hypothetical protein EGW08_020266 [Elysia chlorotica]|uniref:RCC1-like domain-containing protein n=1 Tax=Elysia chlorotica TaxID=188477 RepID=A0A433SS80_ELYCH|nr:hypothetical protein EGW08_020266 [Elysia chlorotica]